LHAGKQRFRRQRADTGALERLNFFPLPRNLTPHALDLGADMFKFHDHAHFVSKEQKGNIFASYKLDWMPKLEPPMSYDKFPDRLSRPMSRGQAATLGTLSVEAYQPKLFEEDLTREEADRRIEALRQEIALANSF
jgi:hypothetical protein